jgi:hypothetical protein
MTQIQQPFTFDRNKFLAEILAGQRNASVIDGEINALTNQHNRDKDGHVYGYHGATTDEALENHLKTYDQDEMIVRSLYELYKNPNSPASAELIRLWNFVGPVLNTERRNMTKQEYLMVLNRLNIFDEQVQLDILHFLYHNRFRYNSSGLSETDYKELFPIILKMLAANPLVSLQDKSEAAHKLCDMGIVRDVVERAKEELNKELNNPDNPIPDRTKLSIICGSAQHAVSGFVSDNEYRKAVTAEFNLDNVLALNPQYVPEMQTSLEEENAQLKKDITRQTYEHSHEVKEKDTKISNLERELEYAKEDLDKQKVKNEKLTRQLNEMEEALREMQAMMKTIKMKAAAITAEGMFGRGKKAEELNDYMQEALKKSKVMIKD